MRIEPARNPLRRARLAARLELSDLAQRTRISPGMLRHMDEGAFDRLPPGIYARAWVRTVAESLSLDPTDVLRQLEGALPLTEPQEPDPVAGMPAGTGRPAAQAEPPWWSSAHLTNADPWRRAAVAALDGTILTGMTLAVWIITALATGATPAGLGPAAGVGISAIALTVAVAYFAVFAGIGGRTPGAALLRCPPEAEVRGPLDLAGIGRRALQSALVEASILVEILMAAGADEMVMRSVLRRT